MRGEVVRGEVVRVEVVGVGCRVGGRYPRGVWGQAVRIDGRG